MSLDPVETTRKLRETYFRYLATAFPIREPELARQFREGLAVEGRFVKGPILEATPPFATGATLRDLVAQGLLCADLLRLDGDHFPVDRRLYVHQETAIRKSVSCGRNIILATGTGSGKTEAFLVPILDSLLREAATGELGSGVRALLLYPMNALANDQLKRLRRILGGCPEVTFGRYTGDTEDDRSVAEERFRKSFPNEPRLPNELLSRAEMRSSPPHLLLTNYAMLEYLLLRPVDSELFDGACADHWRFLVLDEVHTYAGAKGIEAAMLLRRLKDRVVRSEPGRLQCMVTSATLGNGREDYPDTVRFCEELLKERFEWMATDPARQDVVDAQRLPMGESSIIWGAPDPRLYPELKQRLDAESTESVSSLATFAAMRGVPRDVADVAMADATQSADPLNRFLDGILRGDSRVSRLRTILAEGPQLLSEAAELAFPQAGPDAQALEWTAALVDLAARARPEEDASPLLPARYHVFARSLEGAFISLEPDLRLHLDRRQKYEDSDERHPVFEAAICRRCGALYLVGAPESESELTYLRQHAPTGDDEDTHSVFYLLQAPGEMGEMGLDEDEAVAAGEDVTDLSDGSYLLCGSCGVLRAEGSLDLDCGCSAPRPRPWRVHRLLPREGQMSRCIECGTAGSPGIVTRFFSGQDAPVSVLTTTLYQELPPRTRPVPEPIPPQTEMDEWTSSGGRERGPDSSSQYRQLLLFSDSRQDAAFFAPYLQRTYNQILRRRLIVQALERNAEAICREQFRLQDLVEPLLREAESCGVLGSRLSRRERAVEVWRWLLFELRAMDRRYSLEGLGLLGFSMVRPDGWSPPRPLLDAPWGLAEKDAWLLYQILLDGFRMQGAIAYPDGVSASDDAFAPRNYDYCFRESQAYTRQHIFSWLPSSRSQTNRRLDLVQRLAARCDSGLTLEDCERLLQGIWRSITAAGSVWHDYLVGDSIKDEGVVYRLRYQYYQLSSQLCDRDVQWYRCPSCGYLTLHPPAGICPTYRCPGEPSPCSPDASLAGNHYRELYTGLRPIPLVAEEHTAQLTSEAASELQDRFLRGEVNVLSCSTTFELGVDVGELEAVVMRNVPPSAASYLQRAGRAGRRTTSAAFSLTYAQLRPHDLVHFQDPMRMVSGKISPPHVVVRNEKILRRHAYATALAAFWRRSPGHFGNVKAFFFADGGTGTDAVAAFLDDRPPSLQQALVRIIPADLIEDLGVHDWSWVEGLVGEPNGVLRRADDEVRSDVAALVGVREGLLRENRPSDHILRLLNTIHGRSVIDYMSSHNCLPKYGFPVDVVSLQILDTREEARRLELDRDLRIALSEYAPGSHVVAGGRVWLSYGLKLLPSRGLERYRHAICDRCQRYQRVLADAEDAAPLEVCSACGEHLIGRRNRGVFVIPGFGFVTQRRAVSPPPGERRPKRTYASRVFFSGESTPTHGAVKIRLGRVSMSVVAGTNGRLAVLNRSLFKICHTCGFAAPVGQSARSPHQTPLGRECRGKLQHESLGHEFQTDVAEVRLSGYANPRRGFWLSLLYALLEGTSEFLQVSRDDLDGCLYAYSADPASPGLVLFDDVPGGAGHVQRLTAGPKTALGVLQAALARVQGHCGCAPDSSCYGCLRNYRNQYCHNDLARGEVAAVLTDLLSGYDSGC